MVVSMVSRTFVAVDVFTGRVRGCADFARCK